MDVVVGRATRCSAETRRARQMTRARFIIFRAFTSPQVALRRVIHRVTGDSFALDGAQFSPFWTIRVSDDRSNSYGPTKSFVFEPGRGKTFFSGFHYDKSVSKSTVSIKGPLEKLKSRKWIDGRSLPLPFFLFEGIPVPSDALVNEKSIVPKLVVYCMVGRRSRGRDKHSFSCNSWQNLRVKGGLGSTLI